MTEKAICYVVREGVSECHLSYRDVKFKKNLDVFLRDKAKFSSS